jgi:sugar phosphate isomerase/epimerase
MIRDPSSNILFSDSRLILSAGTLLRASFRERVTSAKAAGFDAISLFPQQYLAAIRKEKLTVSDMQEILAEHEIAIDEVDPLLDWFAPGTTPSETLMVEMAQAFGARSMNVAAAFVSDRSSQEITDCFARVCERLAQHGLRADLEFLPWTGVSSLTSALSIVDKAGQANAGVMFDCWHFFNSEDSLDTLRELTELQASRITSLQVNDAPQVIAELSRKQGWNYIRDMFQSLIDSIRVMGFDRFRNVALKARYPHPGAQRMMKDAQCSRLFPGEGDKPLAEVLSILHDKGVRPAIGLEVFNLENYTMSPAEVAQRAMRGYQRLVQLQ